MMPSSVRHFGAAVLVLLAGGLLPSAPPAHAASDAAAPAGEATPDAAATLDPNVGPVTGMPLPRFVSMRAETANARRGPSLDHKVDWTFVRRGMPLEVTAEYGNWRRVRDADGAGGWVHHTLLSGIRTVLVEGETPAVLRAKPEETAPIAAFAEPGVVARLEHCAGAWCELNADGVEGWTPRVALWGVRADETID